MWRVDLLRDKEPVAADAVKTEQADKRIARQSKNAATREDIGFFIWYLQNFADYIYAYLHIILFLAENFHIFFVFYNKNFQFVESDNFMDVILFIITIFTK